MGVFRFDGPEWRVKLTVYDWTDSVPAFRGKPTTFCVQVLPQSANRYHAFALGSQPYYGESIDTAWDTVRSYVRAARFPRQMRKYLASTEERP